MVQVREEEIFADWLGEGALLALEPDAEALKLASQDLLEAA